MQIWDWIYVLCVTGLGVLAAYIRDPQVKALSATIPIPFALAWLATGRPVDISNALSCLLVLVFPQAVRLFYGHWRWPIALAIPLGWSCYLVPAYLLVQKLPLSPLWFWGISVFTMALGALLFCLRGQGGGFPHRTPLPIYGKVPLILVLVVTMVLLKENLGGFMTMFPIMNTLAAYEARHSLSVQCRQVSAFLVAGPCMLATMYAVQMAIGIGSGYSEKSIAWPWGTLVAGILVYALIFIPLNTILRRENGLAQQDCVKGTSKN